MLLQFMNTMFQRQFHQHILITFAQCLTNILKTKSLEVIIQTFALSYIRICIYNVWLMFLKQFQYHF